MADYYTNFSLVLSLPYANAQEYTLELLHKTPQISQGDELPIDIPKELGGTLVESHFETAADTQEGRPTLWLHSRRGGINAA